MELGSGTFLQGDCLELMAGLPDGSVDMVMTSPPYDNLRTYNGMPPFTFDVFAPIADELTRLLKPGGVIVWNVADATVNGSETGSSFRQALYFKDHCGLNLHDTMIWQKPNYAPMYPSVKRYDMNFEYMFIFTKGKITTFNPIKDVPKKQSSIDRSKYKTSFIKDDGSRTVRDSTFNGEMFAKRNIVWVVPNGQTRGLGHPAVFPVSLAQDHILSWSNPGDTILDPFAGSGTTAIAAENAGRRWICMERDPDYYAAAVGRVYDHLTR